MSDWKPTIRTGRKIFWSDKTEKYYLVTKWKELDDPDDTFGDTIRIEALEKEEISPDLIKRKDNGRYYID